MLYSVTQVPCLSRITMNVSPSRCPRTPGWRRKLGAACLCLVPALLGGFTAALRDSFDLLTATVGLLVRRRGAVQAGALMITLVLFGAWTPLVAAGVILQSSAGNYAAFEAEDAHTLGGNNWRIIDLQTPYNHPNAGGSVPVTEVLLPSGTNASGGAAILHDFNQGTSSIAVYRIHFATPGTYRWYIRDGAFENGGVVGYGNEDSMNRPPAFNVDPVSSPPGYPDFDPTYHSYSGQTEGQYGWRNTGFIYTVSEPGVVEFRIRPRETGFSIDRMLFSSTTNLNSTQLDALSNSALGDATHFDGGAGTSDWSEADNWDSGLPTANSLAFIGDGRTVNLSQPGQTAHTLYLGHSGTTLPGNGTLSHTAGDLTLDTLLIGQGGATGTYNIAGGTVTVSGAVQGGSGTSTINLDHGTMNVGTGLSVDHLRVGFVQGNGAPSATLTVGAGSTVRIGDGSGTLTIARMQDTTLDSYIAYGTLDLSLASSTTIDVGEVRMATANARGIQHATLSLGGTTTLTADSFRMADAETGSTPGGRTAMLTLGQTNTFNVDTWTVGGRKSQATVGFGPGITGGVLNLAGNNNVGTNLIIGDNNTSTGVDVTSTVDLSGGTFNATLDTLRIARFGTSTGRAVGSLIMAGGTVTANQVILAETSGSSPTNTAGTLTINGGSFTVTGAVVEGADGLTPGGGGTSTLNLNTGTMSIGTGLDIDNVRVGQNGATGTLTVAAGPVRIGSGTSHAFEVGRKTTGGTTLGTADFGGTSGVAINVGNMNLGVQSSGTPAPTGNTTGIVTLSQNGDNSVVATTLLIGDSPSPGNTGFVSRLNLGPANNDIFANTMTVGGAKSRAEVNVPTGATVNFAARDGVGGMNLRIGFNNSGTSAVSEGTVDLRGATVNALLNSVVIGRHDRSFSPTDGGGADAVFAMDTGIVRANSIVLSVPSAAPSGGQGSADPANTKGTFILDGGQLVAGSIARGANSVASAATFEFNAGTLAFDSFGSVALPMDLDNTGIGTLNPGVDASGAVAAAQLIGTAELFGNYVQGPDATLQIDIDEVGNDLLDVHGDASLAGWLDVALLGPFEAELRDYFDVLTTTGSLDIAGLSVMGDAPNAVFGWWDVSVLAGPGDGAILRLTAVPEPSGVLMLLLVLGGFLASARGRRRAQSDEGKPVPLNQENMP